MEYFTEPEHSINIPNFIIRGSGKQTHIEYEIRIFLPETSMWLLLRRYSRFRELHLSMKAQYGDKVMTRLTNEQKEANSMLPFIRLIFITSVFFSIFSIFFLSLPPRIQIAKIAFPRREIFGSNSETVAKARRRQLETYLRRLLVVCSRIPSCPIYDGIDGQGLTKKSLIEFSSFFKKGLFENSKHGTG